MFTRYYRVQSHSSDLALRSMRFVQRYVVLLSLGIAALMYSSDLLESGRASVANRLDGQSESLSAVVDRFGSEHVAPVAALFVLAFVIVAAVRLRVVFAALWSMLSCTCCRAKADAHASDGHAHRGGLRDQFKFEDLQSAPQHLHDLPSYHIVDNPTYRTILHLSPREQQLVKDVGLHAASMKIAEEHVQAGAAPPAVVVVDSPAAESGDVGGAGGASGAGDAPGAGDAVGNADGGACADAAGTAAGGCT